MASSAQSFLLGFTVLIGIFSISATARPCKTFLISSYSFSINPINPNPNPNPNPDTAGFITIFTEIRRFHPHKSEIFFEHSSFPRVDEPRQIERSDLPFGYDLTSLRDRTKDILSVVVALLFGVGCGALTAVTMYLVWSLFSNRRDNRSSSYGAINDDEDDDIFNPKKIGYEKIPAKEAA